MKKKIQKKNPEEICKAEDLQNLSLCRIKYQDSIKVKYKSKITKKIKRARILGLLPFTHEKFMF